MRRRPAVVAVALSLALVVGSCAGHDSKDAKSNGSSTSTSAADGTGAGAGPNGFTPEPIRWHTCGQDDCATVTAPLDYAKPTGETIHLAVLRAPAGGARRGALFVNPGGPGGSATEFAAQLPLILPRSITDHFDIVGVDPRGVGGSAPFDCGVDYTALYRVDPTVETPADRATLVTNAQGLDTSCQQHAGTVLPHVGTRDDARDIDTVRAAMGDPQLSFFGGSYGTVIGQVYADLFPSHVKAMVLDGIVELGPSGLDLATEQAAGFETALTRFVDHCKGAGACRNANELAAVEQVQALAEQPGGIPAPQADRSAGPGEVNLGLGAALYSASLWPRLDQAISDALHGDGSGMVSLADEYLGTGDFDVYFAVNCLDFAWPSGNPDAFLAAAKAAQTASPHFGEALVSDYLRCVDWPVPPDPLTAVTAPGTPAILVISTTGDPATPYAAGVAVAKRLSKGVLITNQGDGHGALTEGSSCVTALVAAYLVDGAVPADGTVCAST
jgi:pimeloyl-ACP methyl ester carboxylesterase